MHGVFGVSIVGILGGKVLRDSCGRLLWVR